MTIIIVTINNMPVATAPLLNPSRKAANNGKSMEMEAESPRILPKKRKSPLTKPTAYKPFDPIGTCV